MSSFDYKSVTVWDAAGKMNIALMRCKNSHCPNSNAHKNGDRNPSFSVTANGQGFKCFGCGIQGNVVEFVKQMLALERNAAMNWLKDNFGNGGWTMNRSSSKRNIKGLQDQPLQKFLDPEFLKSSQSNLELNVFVQTLMKLGIDKDHFIRWNVANDEDGMTMFFYMDIQRRLVNVKRVQYNSDLHRDKNVKPRFLLKSWGYFGCLFGEHFLNDQNFDKPVVLLESEKSAIISSFVDNSKIWLATGGAALLTREKAKILSGRSVLILFDADASGRTNAQKSKQILLENGVLAHVMDMFPGRNDGRDIADDFLDELYRNGVLG